MEGERQPPAVAVAAAAVSNVLNNDDLLIEILLRVGFPTTLVHAALACKRWLGHVSDLGFLRRFRKLNPPRLLGFYIKYRPHYLRTVPASFIPMLPQPPELASVIRHASFSLDAYLSLSPEILDCQNGNVFVLLYNHQTGMWSRGRVHRPLCRERGLIFNPPLLYPVLQNGFCSSLQFLSKEDGDGLSYYYLYVEETTPAKPESRLHVYMLQDGFCRKHHLLDQLPLVPDELKLVLANSKIYVPAGLSDIIVLDLTTLSFFTIQPPQGVVHSKVGTTMLARAHDASDVYLVHVEDLQLRIWLRKGDNWLLIDSICLREMYANLKISDCMVKDEHTIRLMNQVVDYSDFVFLEMGGCVLHLDIKCRTLHKVYEIKNGCLTDIYPFMMIWPPIFPTLKKDSERYAT